MTSCGHWIERVIIVIPPVISMRCSPTFTGGARPVRDAIGPAFESLRGLTDDVLAFGMAEINPLIYYPYVDLDLTPTVVLSMEQRDLAMACGPVGRYANKSNLLAAAGRFLLNTEDAEAIFTRVSDTVRDSWYAMMRQAGVSAWDCEGIRSAFLYQGLFYQLETT